MSATAFRSAVRKDVLRLLQDKTALTMWLGIPLVIGAMVTMAMGGSGGGGAPTIDVLLLDEDQSLVSDLLLGALGSQRSESLVRGHEVATEDEGRARLLEGDASALIVIPDGFGAALFAEDPTRLRVLTNPSERIKPGIVQEMLEILADGTFYLHRVLGPELREMTQGYDEERPPTEADVARMSVSIHRVVERIEDYLFPPAIELEVVVTEPEGSQPSGLALQFLPGVVLMALFFAAQGMSEDLWRERTQGILRRLCATPHPLALYLAAKCAASALVLVALATVGLAIGMLYHGLPLARLPLAAAWAGLAGTLLFAMMLFLQLFARSQRAGSILTNTILFPLLMIGGSFFPLEAMPAWMANVGRHTPNGWAGTVLADLVLHDAGAARLGIAVAIALAASAPLFLLSALRLRTSFAQGS